MLIERKRDALRALATGALPALVAVAVAFYFYGLQGIAALGAGLAIVLPSWWAAYEYHGAGKDDARNELLREAVDVVLRPDAYAASERRALSDRITQQLQEHE